MNILQVVYRQLLTEVNCVFFYMNFTSMTVQHE